MPNAVYYHFFDSGPDWHNSKPNYRPPHTRRNRTQSPAAAIECLLRLWCVIWKRSDVSIVASLGFVWTIFGRLLLFGFRENEKSINCELSFTLIHICCWQFDVFSFPFSDLFFFLSVFTVYFTHLQLVASNRWEIDISMFARFVSFSLFEHF